MESNAQGGIVRSGASGSYTYAVKSGQENQPVVYVGWYDAVRFANWMNNGQGNGDTEGGVYTLLGGTPVPSNSSSITRNAGAKVFVPTEDEWFKAAYYQGSGAYYTFPTSASATPVSVQPPGTGAIALRAANFYQDDGIANGLNNGYAVTGSTVFSSTVDYLTAVGAFSGTSSFYGTFDQAGNVNEWLEALSAGPFHAYVMGGAWSDSYVGYLGAFGRRTYDRPTENNAIGFRLAGTVPEPASVLGLVTLGAAGLMRWRRERGKRLLV